MTEASNTKGTANMSTSSLKLSIIKEQVRNELIQILESMSGTKVLVIDPVLSGPVGMVIEIGSLKNLGVAKIFFLEPQGAQSLSEFENIIYLVTPKVANFTIIADHVIYMQSKNKGYKNIPIFFVPRRTLICERILEEKGVVNNVSLHELQLDLLPFGNDVLSLELPDGYSECFLDRDRTGLFYVARSLMKIQSIYGMIANIKGKGVCAKLVVDMMLRMKKEINVDDEMKVPEIDSLILIDRQVDMVTPMCMQLTYEGLIDEFMGIDMGHVKLEGSIVRKEPKDKLHNFPLNSEDAIFNEIRNFHFSVLGPYIGKKAKEIESYYGRLKEQNTIGEIRAYAKQLKNYQEEHNSLMIHTSIGQEIATHTKTQEFRKLLSAQHELVNGGEQAYEYIRECINRQDSVLKVLRLLILQSLTGGGLGKQYFGLKREIIQTYGFHMLFVLNNLEKLGLATETPKCNFAYLRKVFKLFNEDFDASNPTDISFAYAGISPLSVRMVQNSAKSASWFGMEEPLKQFPGPLFEEKQEIPEGVKQLSLDRAEGKRNNVTLVFFIGGVTYAEISAIRHLHNLENGRRDFIIATTKLVNGNSIIQSVINIESK